MAKEGAVTGSIQALDIAIAVMSRPEEEDYISLTDIARYRNQDDPNGVVANWMRNRNTIEYLGLWETLNNPDFKPLEFEGFRAASGGNSFTLSPMKWSNTTSAIGILVKSGRYGGGTYAHKDIAFKFAAWISPEFELYVIKDYQRLKQSESHQLALDWSVKRFLTKINYRLHTDSIKEHLTPPELTSAQQRYVYADEADILNVALFGMTAKAWKNAHQDSKGNMRDEATVEQLIVLSNLENANSILIEQGQPPMERLKLLRKMAVAQLERIVGTKSVAELHRMDEQLRLPEVSEGTQ